MLKAVATQVRKAGVLCVVGVALVLGPVAGHARKSPSHDGSMASISVAELPPQGRSTYALIHHGGPFPYDKDGTVFGNRERLLPAHQRGYYREYTYLIHFSQPPRRNAISYADSSLTQKTTPT